MADFIVENGTGISNSNAYVTVAEVDSYLDKYVTATTNPSWLGLTTVNKQRVIQRSTLELDNKFRLRYKGIKAVFDQNLSWPRSNAFDDSGHTVRWDIVPVPVKDSVSEICEVIAGGGDTLPDLNRGGAALKSEKLDVFEREFFAGGAAMGQTVYQMVNLTLSGLVWSTSRLVRG